VGTDGHDAARAWLAERFKTLGLETSTFQFTLDVPVLDLYALPTLTIVDEDGRVLRVLLHRTEFTAHPRSADTPAPIAAIARRAEAAAPLAAESALTGEHRWLILDAVPQGDALATFAAEHAAMGVIGLLVPQLPSADGYLVKRIVGQRPVDLPVMAVRADVLAALDGQRVAASAPIRPTHPEGGHVLGLLPGSDPTLATSPLIVSAHYDGVGDDGPSGAGSPRLPCATDNAAGVAVILEVARLLTAHAEHGERPRRPIVFAALDAEEVNAVGSRAYAAALQATRMTPLVINLDGAARLHETIQVEPGSGADALIGVLDQAGQRLEIPLAVGPVSSDNRRFAAAGFAAVGLSVGLSGLHTPADTPDRVEPEAMRRAGILLLATIWQLAYDHGATAFAS
jgi:aminopeptidase YwaD